MDENNTEEQPVANDRKVGDIEKCPLCGAECEMHFVPDGTWIYVHSKEAVGPVMYLETCPLAK